MQELVTVILAAGAGTRMKSARAKVAHEVCGKPMLNWVMDAADRAGSSQNIVVVGHQAEQVRALTGAEAAVVLQERQLGTGHAVQMAQPVLEDFSGSVMILCGDTPLIRPETLEMAFAAHRDCGNDVTVITAEMPDPTGYGRILRSEGGEVTAIVEHRDATAEQREIREINSGMFIFEHSALLGALNRLSNSNDQNEYYLTDTLALIREDNGRAGAFLISDSDEIMGVNDRSQLAAAEAILTKRLILAHMKNGVAFHAPDSTFLHEDVSIGPDTVVMPGCSLLSGTRIGSGCVIGPNAKISDSEIGDGSHVVASHVSESVVGRDTKIGPFAYLRPGSRIGDHVKIGDFVEIKKSEIGDGTKISHLTYIGDADVGKNVNFGCGVVVVNYDGQKKYRTTVGDNAFVGCNVNLVSPVNVADNAYIAAGSTITEDVPAYALAIARSRQTVINDWVLKKGKQRG